MLPASFARAGFRAIGMRDNLRPSRYDNLFATVRRFVVHGVRSKGFCYYFFLFYFVVIVCASECFGCSPSSGLNHGNRFWMPRAHKHTSCWPTIADIQLTYVHTSPWNELSAECVNVSHFMYPSPQPTSLPDLMRGSVYYPPLTHPCSSTLYSRLTRRNLSILHYTQTHTRWNFVVVVGGGFSLFEHHVCARVIVCMQFSLSFPTQTDYLTMVFVIQLKRHICGDLTVMFWMSFK